MLIKDDKVIFHRYISLLSIAQLTIASSFFYIVFLVFSVEQISYLFLYASVILISTAFKQTIEKIRITRKKIATLDHEKITIHHIISTEEILWKNLEKVIAYKKENTFFSQNHSREKKAHKITQNVLEFQYKKEPLQETSYAIISIDELEVPPNEFFNYLKAYYKGPIENNFSPEKFKLIKNLITLILMTLTTIALAFFLIHKPFPELTYKATISFKK